MIGVSIFCKACMFYGTYYIIFYCHYFPVSGLGNLHHAFLARLYDHFCIARLTVRSFAHRLLDCGILCTFLALMYESFVHLQLECAIIFTSLGFGNTQNIEDSGIIHLCREQKYLFLLHFCLQFIFNLFEGIYIYIYINMFWSTITY